MHACVERAQLLNLHLFLSGTNNPEQDKIEFDHVLLPWRAKARALVTWNIHQNKYKNVSDSDSEYCASTHLCFHRVALTRLVIFE